MLDGDRTNLWATVSVAFTCAWLSVCWMLTSAKGRTSSQLLSTGSMQDFMSEGCNFYSWALVTHGPAQMVTGHFWMLTQWCSYGLSSYFFSFFVQLSSTSLLSFAFSLWNPSFVFKVNFLLSFISSPYHIFFQNLRHLQLRHNVWVAKLQTSNRLPLLSLFSSVTSSPRQ